MLRYGFRAFGASVSSETAFVRARRDFRETLTGSVWAWVWAGICAITSAGASTYLLWGHKQSAQVAISVLTLVIWLIEVPTGVFLWLWIRAPIIQRNEARSALAAVPGPDERLRAAKLPIGTELREIRHKIEIARSPRPGPPRYSYEFQLPVALWRRFNGLLALEAPDLYAIVERAYTAVNRLNTTLQMRGVWNFNNHEKVLYIKDGDGLDAIYNAAGEALDALEEPRGESYEDEATRAVRLAAEDMRRERSKLEEEAED